jgi:hypothetical protein
MLAGLLDSDVADVPGPINDEAQTHSPSNRGIQSIDWQHFMVQDPGSRLTSGHFLSAIAGLRALNQGHDDRAAICRTCNIFQLDLLSEERKACSFRQLASSINQDFAIRSCGRGPTGEWLWSLRTASFAKSDASEAVAV